MLSYLVFLVCAILAMVDAAPRAGEQEPHYIIKAPLVNSAKDIKASSYSGWINNALNNAHYRHRQQNRGRRYDTNYDKYQAPAQTGQGYNPRLGYGGGYGWNPRLQAYEQRHPMSPSERALRTYFDTRTGTWYEMPPQVQRSSVGDPPLAPPVGTPSPVAKPPPALDPNDPNPEREGKKITVFKSSKPVYVPCSELPKLKNELVWAATRLFMTVVAKQPPGIPYPQHPQPVPVNYQASNYAEQPHPPGIPYPHHPEPVPVHHEANRHANAGTINLVIESNIDGAVGKSSVKLDTADGNVTIDKNKDKKKNKETEHTIRQLAKILNNAVKNLGNQKEATNTDAEQHHGGAAKDRATAAAAKDHEQVFWDHFKGQFGDLAKKKGNHDTAREAQFWIDMIDQMLSDGVDGIDENRKFLVELRAELSLIKQEMEVKPEQARVANGAVKEDVDDDEHSGWFNWSSGIFPWNHPATD